MAIESHATSNKWWSRETVAVVTGANRGIGFEIVRQLADNGLTVVLTSRDTNKGLAATKILNDQGLNNVVFRQLDIQSPESILEFAGRLKDNYGGLDILINNAAILGADKDMDAAMNALKHTPIDKYNDPNYAKVFTTNFEMTKDCFEINYYGTKRITEALLPLLRSEARIVNVSSEAGLLKWLRNESLREELSDVSKITEEYIDKMIKGFLHDVENGVLEDNGWPRMLPQYCASKIALNSYARILTKKLSECEDRNIYVNNVHPGVVQTEMTNYLGQLTPSQGAESVVMVALLPPGGPSGKFYFMKDCHSF